MMKLIKSLIKEEKGQGLVEYALIIALIALVVIAAISGVGDRILNVFKKIEKELPATS